MSPDEKSIIYAIGTPRTANEKAGGSHLVYYRMDLKDRKPKEIFNDSIKVSSPTWSPDGKFVSFLHKVKGGKKQVWVMMPIGS